MITRQEDGEGDDDVEACQITTNNKLVGNSAFYANVSEKLSEKVPYFIPFFPATLHHSSLPTIVT